MRILTLTPATIGNARGTIRGGSFMAARRAALRFIAWLLKSGRVPRDVSC